MTRFLIAVALVACSAAPALAQTAALDAARARGAVGERYDGYMGIAAPVSDQVVRDVGRVNIERKALYARLAQQKGVSLSEVGITAGCTMLGRVGAGQSYLWADGVWHRRAAGAAPPVPSYCA